MPVIEMTLEQLRADYDWAEVFGEGNGGNTDGTVEAVPPGSLVSTSPAIRADVSEVIALVNGENDGAEWIGLFRLSDGRFLVATGSCDYTGWDCQAGNHLAVAATLADAVRF